MPGRCFLAIDLPTSWADALASVRSAYLHEARPWAGEKWVAPELLHVTMRFIGPIEDCAVVALLGSLQATCAPAKAPRLTLSGVRAVPSPRRASMLWSTVHDEDGVCGRLAHAIDEALEAALGLQPESRAFSPHVTLVRARSPRAAPSPALDAANARLASGPASVREMSVRSLTLYSSTLGRSGPDYRVLGRVHVGG